LEDNSQISYVVLRVVAMARKKKVNKTTPKKKPFPNPANGEVSKEQWEKWNMEYFGEQNFQDDYPTNDDGEPEELNFDR
jgi:hypothetical protein